MFTLILVLVYSINAQFSTSPTWIGNPYLQTDSYQVITDFETVSQSGGANITFSQTYSTPPQVAFGITTYSGNDGLFDEDFFMQTVRVTQTLAQLNIFMKGATNIRILYVMYLAVHPDFLYHLNSFNDVEANYSSTGPLSLFPINTNTSQVRIFTNYINYTQMCEKINARHKYFGSDLTKNKIAVYLSGIFNYVYSKDLNEIKFDILTEAVNMSFFKLQITVSPTYQIDLLKLSFIAMDIQNIQTSKQYTIIYNTERYYFDQDYFIPLQKQFFGDVFIGMLDFNTLSPRCTIDFNLVFQPENSRIVVKKSVPHKGSLYPNCGLNSARLVTFYMKTWFCPEPFYYFNLQTDMCDDYCTSYFYGNKTAGQCRPCPLGCVRCDPLDPDTCTHCDRTNDFRVLKNGKCQCMEGFYQHLTSDVICTSCQVMTPYCSKCSFQTNFVCEDCKQGWYLDENQQCQPCNLEGCIDCQSLQECVLCDINSNYLLIENKTCSQCQFTCLCDGYSLPKIFDKKTGNYQCSTICGDGLVRQKQQCDDGNKIDNDGCNSECLVQDYWTCDTLNGSTCCVIKQEEMQLKVDSIIKSKGENAFEIELILLPYIPFLTAQKLISSLKVNLKGIKFTKEQILVYDTQRIRLKYYYSEHVQKKQCNITLKLSLTQQTNLGCSMQVQSSMLFYPQSSNNQPLIFFDTQVYKQQESAEKMSQIILYISYGILVLSMIPCKIVGLQLFGVLQLSYFALAQMSNLNLMLVPFINLSASNGFNPNIFGSKNALPQKIRQIQFDSMFINNCGVMLGVLVIEALIGLILYVLFCLIKKPLWLSSVSKRLLKEGFLTLISFNAFNFAFATGVHFKYSDPSEQYYLLNSILSIISLVAPLLIIVGLIFTQQKGFGQFKNKFKQQLTCQMYFVVTIVYRYLLGYFMAVKSENQLGSLIVIIFSLLFILYNFVNLPFRSVLHNYRANICHLSQLGILLVANYYESMKATTELQTKSIIFSPAYFQMGMIMLTVFISVIGLMYEIRQFIKSLCFNNRVKNHLMIEKYYPTESYEINQHYIDQATRNKLQNSNESDDHNCDSLLKNNHNNKSNQIANSFY